MYTDDKNAQVVLSLLKQYGIKKIVVSPGTTNVPVSRSVQLDPWFEVYSVIDERSAAYFASGLAYSSNEPVVISCTGATASRNYLSGLTEAFYRNLPIIALTSQHHVSDFGNLVPQVTDRTVSQNDVKRISVLLPVVKDDEDYERCILSANKALIAATTHGGGPVHINLHVTGDYSFTTPELPVARKIDYYHTNGLADIASELGRVVDEKRTGIFIGAHRRFDATAKKALEKFATTYNIPIFIDHTSGYAGKNAVLLSQIADLKWSSNKPELVIDMGSITGDYSIDWLKGVESWRLSEDGSIHDRLGNQTKLFDGPETKFFAAFDKTVPSSGGSNYYAEIEKEVAGIVVPEKSMPLSNTYISYKLSGLLPRDSSLHLGILNSLRNMNFFKLDESINSSSNVGGFGIDGALSTLIGQSMVDKTKLHFGLVGDLAAFYDMNALGIRHVGKNIRILLVNNNGGVEFRLNSRLETQWAEDTNEFISACGHNGSIRGWAESMGFHYMTAGTKQEFDKQVKEFCSPEIDAFTKPVLFEVFTNIPDEQTGVNVIQNVNRPQPGESSMASPDQLADGEEQQHAGAKDALKQGLKKVMPKSVKTAYRKLRGRD